MVSIIEQYLNEKEFHTAMKGFAGINKYYLERKREQGFNEAKGAGTVGRQTKETEGIEKAIRLYHTKTFSVTGIESQEYLLLL